MWETIKPAVIRAVRTFIQAFLGVYLAGFVTGQGLNGFADIGLLNSAAAAGVIAVLAFAQNWLETTKNLSVPRA